MSLGGNSEFGAELKSISKLKPTIAVLGATGGCILAFLIRALKDDYSCSAVVRTPSKLTNLLRSYDLSESVIEKNLTIIEGNAKDSVKVAEALRINDEIVDIIVSGVGGVPIFKPNPLRPTLDDPTICQDTTSTVLNALRDLQSHHQPKSPLMVVISTTGISDFGRDIPAAMIPLYRWLLPIPHKDKKMMENVLIDEVKVNSDGGPPAIKDFVAIRPSLLTNKPALGVGAVRAAAEKDGKIDKSGIGYTISRLDVGSWIFEVLVENKDGRREEFLNQCVSITT